HTRFSRDWSSDVCSSDLTTGNSGGASGNAFDAITGSPQFTASQKYGAGMAAFNPTSGADCHLDWTGLTQAGDVFCIRLYMYLVRSEERRVGKGCRCRWAT